MKGFDLRLSLLAPALGLALLLGPLGAQAADEAPKKAEAKKAVETPKGDLVPLDIQLPKPLFIGTPKNITTPNLEPATNKKREPFLAPAGVKNLAAGKSVSSSDEEPIVGELALITDGDKEGQDGSFVELGPGVQWVQIDLGQTSEIFAVVLWHFHAQAQVVNDVVVRVAADPDFIAGVKTIFNNDNDNSAGFGVGKDKDYIESYEGKLVDAKGAKGRYVRLYSDGNTTNELNHYIEAEIYGRPADAAKAPASSPAKK